MDEYKITYSSLFLITGKKSQASTKLVFFYVVFVKNILLIMLLQLSKFFPLCPNPPATPLPSNNPTLCSCPWVMHIGSLAT